jgi:methyl-accepting chemotaxis protein PixJ
MTQLPSKSRPAEATNNSANGLKSPAGQAQLTPVTPVERTADLKPPGSLTALSWSGTRKPEAEIVPTAPSKPSAWQRLSVKTKATVIAVVLATVPIVGIGAITYYFVNLSMTDQVYKTKQRLATQVADATDVYIRGAFAEVQVISQLPVFRNASIYSLISQAERESMLDRFIEIYRIYDGIALFDLEGNVLAQTNGPTVPNHFTRDYFQRILQNGQPTVNSPSLSRTTGKLSFHFAAPVKDSETEQLTGVVRIQWGVETLNRLVLEKLVAADPAGANRYYLIDSNGKYFAATGDPDRVGKLASEHFAKYAQLQTSQDVQTVFDIDPDNQSQQLLTYKPLRDLVGISGLNFGVLVVSNATTAFAPQRQLLLTILMGVVVASLLVGAIAAVLANRATRPILAAADAVAKIGDGDLGTRLEFKGTDEIASLAVNINQMAGQLGILVQEQANAADRSKLLADVANARTVDLEGLFEQFTELLEVAREALHVDRVMLYYFTGSDRGAIVAEAALLGLPLALGEDLAAFTIPASLREACQQDICIPMICRPTIASSSSNWPLSPS